LDKNALKTLHTHFPEPHDSGPHKAASCSLFQIGILLLITLLSLSGCDASNEPEEPTVIRTAKATFTPTAIPVVEAPIPTTTPSAEGSGATSAPADPTEGNGAKAVINTPLVNVRAGPSTDDEVVGTAERGAEFDIIGISPDQTWWYICCIDGTEAWVINEFVDTLGPVDSVPVVGGPATGTADREPADTEQAAAPPAGAEPTIAAEPSTPAPTAAPVVNFILESQEQFPETGVVRIFLYVFSGNDALGCYSLRVTKYGAELPVEGTSFAGQPAFTWPFQDPRQRFQNFKVEYDDTPAQGVWQVQLIDNTGATVGPPATFTLSSNDPQQELYVRYAQR
jgi:hypothetical protein